MRGGQFPGRHFAPSCLCQRNVEAWIDRLPGSHRLSMSSIEVNKGQRLTIDNLLNDVIVSNVVK